MVAGCYDFIIVEAMNYSPLILSAKLALMTTAVLLVICAPLAYGLSCSRFRGKVVLESLLGLPLVLPPTVLGFYLLALFGPEGIVGRFWQAATGGALAFTFAGIAIASMIHGLPYALQPLKASFDRLDRRLLEAASVLGATRIVTFFRVAIPNAIGGIAAAAVLVFAHTMGEFGVILMVGGSIPDRTRVASIAIYENVEALRYDEAWHLSLALLLISFLVLILVNLLNKGENGS